MTNTKLAKLCLEELFNTSISVVDKSYNVPIPIEADNQVYTVVGIGSMVVHLNPIINTMKLYISIPLTKKYSVGYFTGLQLYLMDVLYNGSGVVHFIPGEHDEDLIRQMLHDMYE